MIEFKYLNIGDFFIYPPDSKYFTVWKVINKNKKENVELVCSNHTGSIGFKGTGREGTKYRVITELEVNKLKSELL